MSRYETIYHGTDHILKKPEYGKGSSDMDYGQGFYTTKDPEWGKAWGCMYGDTDNAVCNQYQLDTKGLNVLYLDDYGPLSLLAELIYNRELEFEQEFEQISTIVDLYKVDTSKADVVIGYRANAAYIQVVESFLKGHINLNEMEKLFQKGDMGQQLFLKSKKAFDQIKHTGYDRVKEEHLYVKKDFVAKKETKEFLIKREKDVKIGLCKPSGILVDDVVNEYFKYDKESKFCFVADYEEMEEPVYEPFIE